MKLFSFVFALSILLISSSFAQEKSKGCCSDVKTNATLSKICDVPDDASIQSSSNNNLTASLENDDKNKSVEKNLKSTEKNIKTDKSKNSSSEEGCCSTDKKKTEKTKSSKS